jgi:hypothetical protein
MMAVVLRAPGSPPALEDFDEPVAREGALVVGVLSAGLNPVDLVRMFEGPLLSVPGNEGVAALAGGQLLTYGNRTTPAAVKRAAYERMSRHLLAGELRVEYERIELARFADAFTRQTRHPHRKLVLVPPAASQTDD